MGKVVKEQPEGEIKEIGVIHSPLRTGVLIVPHSLKGK